MKLECSYTWKNSNSITQPFNDIPSDLGHHRALKYLPNDEGYRNLSNDLYKRIRTIIEEKIKPGYNQGFDIAGI
jgi:hypothetical protein